MTKQILTVVVTTGYDDIAEAQKDIVDTVVSNLEYDGFVVESHTIHEVGKDSVVELETRLADLIREFQEQFEDYDYGDDIYVDRDYDDYSSRIDELKNAIKVIKGGN